MTHVPYKYDCEQCHREAHKRADLQRKMDERFYEYFLAMSVEEQNAFLRRQNEVFSARMKLHMCIF